MHFISSFKVMYLNAWGLWVRPEHVECIDETNTFVVVDGNTYVSISI